MSRRGLGVRGTLAAFSLAGGLVAALLGAYGLESRLGEVMETRARDALWRHATSLQVFLQGAIDADAAHVQAAALAREQGYRLTLVSAEGILRRDGAGTSPGEPGERELGGLPEVQDALAQGQATSRRYDARAQEDLLFAALPVKLAGEIWVLRLALPLRVIDANLAELRRIWVAMLALSLLLPMGTSMIGGHLIARSLHRLAREARARLAGKGRVRTSALTGEVEAVASSLNQLAGALEVNVGQLAQERDRFQAVLDGISDGVIALDETRRIVIANRAAWALFGLLRSPVGSPLIEVVRSPSLMDALDREPDPERAIEFELAGRHPRKLVAHASRAALSGGIVLVFADVTEMRRLESIRTDFVANVSHELRTPVSVIRASAEALVSGGLSDPARGLRFAQAVHRNAERLSRLVSDLLDLSRIEAGRAWTDEGSANLTDVVERVVSALAPMAEERGHELRVEAEAGLAVTADPIGLEQVLSNLVENALKYTPGPGCITVRVRARETRVLLEVEDNGPGIPDEHKARVFERFYRVDAGRSREVGGTGLGLSIVRHLALAFGGSAWVEDAPSTGARFIVELPLNDARGPGER